jgi:hypothetical protein
MEVQVQQAPFAAVRPRGVAHARRAIDVCQRVVQLATRSAGGCGTGRAVHGELAGRSSRDPLEQDGADAVELEPVEHPGDRQVAGRRRHSQHLLGDALADPKHDLPVAPGGAGASAQRAQPLRLQSEADGGAHGRI